MVRFGAQGAPPPPGITTRSLSLPNTVDDITGYNNVFMGYWADRIHVPRAQNPFQNHRNDNHQLIYILREVCIRYNDTLTMEWVVTSDNLRIWTNRVGPDNYVVDEWNRMADHDRYHPGRCRAIFKTPVRRLIKEDYDDDEDLGEDLNDGSGRRVKFFQIVFDPDYTQIVHRTDTISRSNSGLYLNFYVILYTEDNNGNEVPIVDNNNSPIKYHMYLSLHENKQPGPGGFLQTHPSQPNIPNRIHMAMRRGGNLPIVNTPRYHVAVDGYNNITGLIIVHRTDQDNNNNGYPIYSRTLLQIFKEAYSILRKCRMVEMGFAPNNNNGYPIWQNIERCRPTSSNNNNNNNKQ